MNYIQQVYKGENKLWMFILTTVLVSGIFVVNLIVFLFLGDGIDVAAEQKKLLQIVPSKNFWLAVNLLPFAFLLGLLFVLVKYLHKRSLLSLTTSRKKVDWGRAFFSFGLIAGFTIVAFVIGYYIDPSKIEWQFDPLKFSILVLISVILFPLQIGLEEYLFRGYLMQYLGVMVRNRWFPLLLTSVLFGIFHGANPEVAEMGLVVMIFYMGTGLFLGIITLMDEGLELALGFHLGNNLLAAILVTADWSALQTDALFRYTAQKATNTLAEILVPVLVVYPILLYVFSKKYNWSNWKEKLLGHVDRPTIQDDNFYTDDTEIR